MLRIPTAAATALLLSLISSCSMLPQAQKVADPRSIYVWPVRTCPSSKAPEQRVFFSALTSLLFGNVASALVGIPAGALNAAAEADKAGFTASGTNARFFYSVDQAQDPETNTTKVELVPPECYVVAFARPVEKPVRWCEDPLFAAGVPESCKHGAATLHGLFGREILEQPHKTPAQYLSVPEFYAEIGFDLANYGSVVRPALRSLYYPSSLLRKGSTKPRTLSLTILLSSSLKDDPFKAAAIALKLVGIEPAPTQPAKSLALPQTGWTVVPTQTPQANDPKPIAGKSYLPVTMTATLHEVGQPSLFLAAFAKAFSGSSADYAKAITNELLPAAQQSTQLQNETNKADYHTKYAAAEKSFADYVAACAKNPQSEPDKASASSLWYALVGNRMKANVAAKVAGVDPPYSDPEGGKTC